MLIMLVPGQQPSRFLSVSLLPHFWRLCNIHVIIYFTILCCRLASMQMVAGIFVSLTQKFSTAIMINGLEPAM